MFVLDLENWLTTAMGGAPPSMLQIKLTAVSAFSSSLRRYTSLNHLAQAARAVLHNSNQIGEQNEVKYLVIFVKFILK